MSQARPDYRRFIDHPQDIARLEGQRFVVLRPTGAVPDAYLQVRAQFQERFADRAISFPAAPHVTLTGFPKGSPLDRVRTLVAGWACTIGPMVVEVERLAVFPSPFQIVIIQVKKTAALFHALASLEHLAREAGLGDVTAVPHDQWVFHMSLAYCRQLDAQAWGDVVRAIDTLHVTPASCVVHEAELVSFDDGLESLAATFALSGTRPSP